MADFDEASVAGFQHVYPDAGVAGCWLHYAPAIIRIVHLCLIWCRVVSARATWSRVVQSREVSPRNLRWSRGVRSRVVFTWVFPMVVSNWQLAL